MTPGAQLRVRASQLRRLVRERYDDPEFRQARLLAARVRRQPPSVLHLGASESIFVSPADADARPLPAMLRDGLPDPAALHSVVGAGYQPDLYQQILRIAGPIEPKPVVVLVCVPRIGLGQWWHHPRYGYRDAVAELRAVRTGAAPLTLRRRPRAKRPEVMEAYDAVMHPSFLGPELTRGYFRVRLGDQAVGEFSPEEVERLRYAYFWGGAGEPGFHTAVTALGAYLRASGYPVVPYAVPLPIERAEAVHPGTGVLLRSLADEFVDAFRRGYGPVDVVDTGLDLPARAFIDPYDATEHVNEEGRARLSADIMARVLPLLSGSAAS